MNNSKQLICLLLLFFTIAKASAQEQDTLHICYNGGFELPLSSTYQFTNDPSIVTNSFSCSYDIPTPTPYLTSIGLDQFSDPVTLVSPGYDPILSAAGINLDRVASGNKAIKLNDINGDLEVTTMTKEFIVSSSSIHFKFALVAGNPAGDPTYAPSYFRARVYNFDKSVIIAEYCIEFDDANPEFTTAGDYIGDDDTQFYEFLYKSWECEELQIIDPENDDLKIGDVAYLEFRISDNAKSQFASVYIDDICDTCEGIVYVCPDCPRLHGDVPSGTDEVEALNCIKAYNTIGSGATALYYAGYDHDDDDDPEDVIGEILLLPGTDPLEPADTLGFECLLGSTGHFYIEDCPFPFYQRHAMTQPEQPALKPTPTSTLQIFPNPAYSELNILSDVAVRSVRMVSLDGKLVLQRQPGADDNKNIRLDVSNLSSGIYILNIENTDGSVTTHKIVRE